MTSSVANRSYLKKPHVLFFRTEEEDAHCGLPKTCLQILRQHFVPVSLSRYEEEPQLRESIAGVITAGAHGVHGALAPVIPTLPALRVVTTIGAGYEHLTYELEFYRKYGIKVGNSPASITRPTADFTFALLLASARDLLGGIEEATGPRHTEGFYFFRSSKLGADVGGATIGIVGMGRIGYEVARRARGFDMTVLYHNRNRRPAEDERNVKATYYSDLTQMVPLCDYLVICCPLTPDTRHLISRQVLSLMKKSATLVNTARGIVVDTDALVDALETGSIRGAALDVTDPEPLPEGHPLLTLPNALVTAHRGFCDQAAQEHLWQETCDILKAVLIDNDDIPKHCRLC